MRPLILFSRFVPYRSAATLAGIIFVSVYVPVAMAFLYFSFEKTQSQEVIFFAAYLIGWLCEKYDIVPDKNGVKGHRDLMATACPGSNLYEKLQTIRGKAIWYQQHYQKGD